MIKGQKTIFEEKMIKTHIEKITHSCLSLTYSYEGQIMVKL